MAAVLPPGMLSHREQTMASDDYPDWLTAEHRTGVSEIFFNFDVRPFLYEYNLICGVFLDNHHGC